MSEGNWTELVMNCLPSHVGDQTVGEELFMLDALFFAELGTFLEKMRHGLERLDQRWYGLLV